MHSFYLFGSRVATHILFWLLYYLAFGFIWGSEGNYWQSYYLEFVLLPVRILAVYVTIYVLIPTYLKERKLWHMLMAYLGFIALCAVLQRTFTYFFYEGVVVAPLDFWEWRGMMRNVILINSTVLFVSALKITQLWWTEKDRVRELEARLSAAPDGEEIVEIRSDKRIHRVPASRLLFVEGMGNYAIFHTVDRKLISYSSLKKAVEKLPAQFQRIHKSYVINSDKVTSYDQDNVEIQGKILPIGKAYRRDVVN